MKLARLLADACWGTLGASGESSTLRARSIHEDTDDDGDVDASDKWFHHAFDEQWRWVATFREDDSDPKEEFLHHAAGLDGRGTGSYIDLVILRDRDINSGWTSAADGTLEERIYYCQNWRADVSALVTDGGQMLEWVKYSAYGVPFGLPGGDADSDGDCDASDVSQVNTWWSSGPYDVRGDIDLDGDVDATDSSTISTSYYGIVMGRGVLSDSGVWNRRGYAGYEWNPTQASPYCARYRSVAPGTGRWSSRDFLPYFDSANLYEYTVSAPMKHRDSYGLCIPCIKQVEIPGGVVLVGTVVGTCKFRIANCCPTEEDPIPQCQTIEAECTSNYTFIELSVEGGCEHDTCRIQGEWFDYSIWRSAKCECSFVVTKKFAGIEVAATFGGTMANKSHIDFDCECLYCYEGIVKKHGEGLK